MRGRNLVIGIEVAAQQADEALVRVGAVAGKADDDRVAGIAAGEIFEFTLESRARRCLVDYEMRDPAERVGEQCVERDGVTAGAAQLVDLGREIPIDANEEPPECHEPLATDRAITRVDVSVNGGRQWSQATIEDHAHVLAAMAITRREWVALIAGFGAAAVAAATIG